MTLPEIIETLRSMAESLEIDVPSDAGYVEGLQPIIEALEVLQMVSVHLNTAEQRLGFLKGGIESCLPFPPNGVIIHKGHVLETIEGAIQPIEACRDLLGEQDLADSTVRQNMLRAVVALLRRQGFSREAVQIAWVYAEKGSQTNLD